MLSNGSVANRLFIGVVDDYLYIGNGSVKTKFNNPVWMYSQGHFVFVFEDNVVSLYMNGVFAERITLPVDVVIKGNVHPRLGAQSSQASEYFRMSDLRIYNAALTAEQIRDLYHYEYVPDEETEKVFVVRAADVKNCEGLMVDQSCALPGKAYLRQKNPSSSGWVNWSVDAEAGNYALYLLMRGYTTETSLVEVSVNNVNYGVHRLRSSGLWESVRVGDSLKFALAEGANTVSVRPVGSVGIAGLAVVSSPRDFDAVKLDFGQANWKDPEPRVEVRLFYDNAGDKTWARPRVKFRNLTGNSYPNAHFRYFYKGEGSGVQAKSFWPDLPMSVIPDAGDVFYADLALTEPIAPYGNVYGNDGLQLGLHRSEYFLPWNIFDDPSYATGSENGYVVANGVALLDENGKLLNEWQCYDDGAPAEQAKPSVRALAKEETDNPSQSSRIRIVVENNGSVAVDGFEVRYYYRDANGRMAKPDYYDFAFADTSFANVGGDLYYVSFMYTNSALNPGERNAFGNGAQFALHNVNWLDGFSASDDPSHHGLTRELTSADSVVVLDRNGNLLWGNVPQPKFANNFVIKPLGKNRVTRVGDVVYVEIDETGYYTLETVNAIGMPLVRLFEGTWKPGEYMVEISAEKFNAGGYLVLRKGNEILNWQLLK